VTECEAVIRAHGRPYTRVETLAEAATTAEILEHFVTRTEDDVRARDCICRTSALRLSGTDPATIQRCSGGDIQSTLIYAPAVNATHVLALEQT
jgi:hypothetical protein